MYFFNSYHKPEKCTYRYARELTRHYITFLKEVIPYAWVDSVTKEGAFPKSSFKLFLQDAGLTEEMGLLTMDENIHVMREKFINLVIGLLQGQEEKENGLKRLFITIKERFDSWTAQELQEKYTYMSLTELISLAKNTIVDKKSGGKKRKYFFQPQSIEYFERPVYSHFLKRDFDLKEEESGEKIELVDSKTSIKFELTPLNKQI